MPLHWIVPARRLVVGEAKATHQEILEAWVAQLREHRDALVPWYRGVAGPGVDLGAGIDRAIERLEQWTERFFEGPPDEVVAAAAPADANQHDEIGFWPRLWGGPLRVLAEEEAAAAPGAEEEEDGAAANDDAPPDTTPIVSEVDVEGTVTVHLDRTQRIVLNHDAEFLPGDILELPLFRLLWLAGIGTFAGASFNGQGSCFLGTAVNDAAGQSPGRVWLHDNMTAMRFQLLFNAARGAFHSFESSFSDRDQTRKTNPVDILGKTLHARGFTYGGVLLPPGKGSHFQCYTNGWGTNTVPTRATLNTYRSGTRLTNGWACNPSAMCLLTFMTENTEGWGRGGGSVNGNARKPGGMTWIQEVVNFDFFHHTAQAVGGVPMLRELARQRGLTGDSIRSEAIRELALRRLLGRPIPPALAAAPDVAPDADSDDEEEGVPEHSPAPATAEEVEAESDPVHVVPDGDDEDEEHESAESDEEHHLPEPTLDVDAVLPGNQEVSISKAQMLQYMDGAAMAAVGLDGHEYSWVVVHSHDSLLTEEPQEIDGQSGRPPQSGKIAVFDPLSGTPYVPADGDPSMFVFEATGSFNPCKLLEPGVARRDKKFNFTVFKVRPFRWLPMEEVWLYRETHRGGRRRGQEIRLQIGESASYSASGRDHVRRKNLLGISRVAASVIDERHRQTRTFVPLFLHNVRGPRVAREYETAGYASRAVPFPTLAESGADTRYATLGQATTTQRDHVAALRAEQRRLAQVRSRAGHLTAADRAYLESTLRGSFAGQVRTATRNLLSGRDARVTRLTGTINNLRRRLDRRYEPDGGQSRETQTVERRSSFRQALRAQSERENTESRPTRRSRRRRATSEARLDGAVRQLAATHAAVPDDWNRLAESVVIRNWIGHVRDLIGMLSRADED